MVVSMRGAGDTLSVGERIAFFRRRRGITQAVLAGLVGRSEDWLSKIERGDRQLRRLDIVAEVAKALRVTVGDLLGQPALLEDDAQRDDNVPAVRDALMAPRRLSRVLFADEHADQIDAGEAALAAEHCWSDFQAGRIGKVVTTLPSLIVAARALEESSSLTDRAGWAVSARVHHLVASTMSKIGEADLAGSRLSGQCMLLTSPTILSSSLQPRVRGRMRFFRWAVLTMPCNWGRPRLHGWPAR